MASEEAIETAAKVLFESSPLGGIGYGYFGKQERLIMSTSENAERIAEVLKIVKDWMNGSVEYSKEEIHEMIKEAKELVWEI